MKKINKIAAQDAARYVEANAFLSEIGDRFYADKNYAKAFNDAYDRIAANQTAVYVAQKLSTPTAVKIRRVGLIAVGVVILHETGYDKVVWDKLKSFGRKAQAQTNEVKEAVREEYPTATAVAEDLKDTVVDTAKDVSETAKQATDEFIRGAKERFEKGEETPRAGL